MIKTLLFDLDGVLVRFTTLRSKIAFIQHGLWLMSRTYGVKKSFLAMTAAKDAMEENKVNLLTNEERAVNAFARVLKIDEEEAGLLYQKICTKIFPKLSKYFSPVPNACDFVLWAKENYELYLATNPLWPEEMAYLRLQWANIESSLFKGITHSQNMHFAKPHVNYYQEVLEKFNLKTDEVLMIGDSFKKDAPATMLGIKTFILSSKLDHKYHKYKDKLDQRYLMWGDFNYLKKVLTS